MPEQNGQIHRWDERRSLQSGSNGQESGNSLARSWEEGQHLELDIEPSSMVDVTFDEGYVPQITQPDAEPHTDVIDAQIAAPRRGFMERARGAFSNGRDHLMQLESDREGVEEPADDIPESTSLIEDQSPVLFDDQPEDGDDFGADTEAFDDDRHTPGFTDTNGFPPVYVSSAVETVPVPSVEPISFAPPSEGEVQRMLAERQAKAQREQDRLRAAEIERARLDLLFEEKKSGIIRTVSSELESISVFNEADLLMDFGREFAGMVTKRAHAHANGQISFGNIDDLNLFATAETAEGSGKRLVVDLIEGRVPGASDELRRELMQISGYEPDSNERKRRPFSSHRSIRLDMCTNDDAWDLIAEAGRNIARRSSASAHEKFFTNIRRLPDGTVEHRHPDHKDKELAEHDFDELVMALRIPESDYFKKNKSEFGIYIPLEKTGKPDAIDALIKYAGGVNSGNIVNVEGFGHGAFVALITTSDAESVDPSAEGGYLVFVHHPLVPGYESKTMVHRNSDLPFTIRNTRELPVMAEDNVIEFAVNAWHLTPTGFSWAHDKIQRGDNRAFADPRDPLREGHKLVVNDVRERRAAIDQIQSQQRRVTDFTTQLVELVAGTSASDLRERNEQILEALKGLNVAVQNTVALGTGEETLAIETGSSED